MPIGSWLGSSVVGTGWIEEDHGHTSRRVGERLESLIPSAEGRDDFRRLKLDEVVPNPNQPRTNFDEEALAELAASIAEVGVLQPVVVRPLDDGRYALIAGERRWRAARQAGLTEIPAVIRTSDDQHSLTEALIENLQRQDLGPLEEAAAYKALMEDFGMSHEQVAQAVGKSRPAVTNTLRLLQPPAAIQEYRGELSAGHARALLAIEDTAHATRPAGGGRGLVRASGGGGRSGQSGLPTTPPRVREAAGDVDSNGCAIGWAQVTSSTATRRA